MGVKLPGGMEGDEDYKLKIISEMQGFSVFVVVVAKWLREPGIKRTLFGGPNDGWGEGGGVENTQAALKPSLPFRGSGK